MIPAAEAPTINTRPHSVVGFDGDQSLLPARKFRLADPELRKQLELFCTEGRLSRKQVATKLGVDPSYVAKFINGSNDFDPSRMERVVADVLKAERVRSKDALALFETPFTRQIVGAYETVRKTGDFGLLFCAAGMGKTCSMQLFLAQNPSAIGFTASKGLCSKSAIEHMVFSVLENRAWNNCTPRWMFMVEHLKDSNRPIIVDNAQRLSRAALQWFFDFHDETGVPVVFQGNPEVLDLIRKNDQMFSRIGLKSEIRPPDAKSAAEVVDSMLAKMVPDWADDLRGLALQVAIRSGHFRALRKQLTLATELSLSGGQLADPVTAFRAAHLRLVRDYALNQED